ncbi:hypothetical protein [Vibrio gallicus]|uniref:hypothetical protein n=1 Tax=Vibrio gallicus TaxID=190897 RepID=UPI0021C2FA89|nr:hypothetical protein [Vibrio gallicus]
MSRKQVLIYLAIVVGLLMTSTLPTAMAQHGAMYEPLLEQDLLRIQSLIEE